MSAIKNPSPTLDYATPGPAVPWRRRVADIVSIVGWATVLGFYPFLVFWFHPSMRRTSGSTDPEIDSLNWAMGAIAVRAIVALIRRGRSRAWIIYLVLYVVLEFLAVYIGQAWRSHH